MSSNINKNIGARNLYIGGGTEFESGVSGVGSAIGWASTAASFIPGPGTVIGLVGGAVSAGLSWIGGAAAKKVAKERAEADEKTTDILIDKLEKRSGDSVTHNNGLDRVQTKEFSIEHNHRNQNNETMKVSGYGANVEITNTGAMSVNGQQVSQNISAAYKKALDQALEGQFTAEEKEQFKKVQEMIGQSGSAANESAVLGAISGLQKAANQDFTAPTKTSASR